MIPKDEWVWMPHPGHLIVGQDCRFHLCTRVGAYLISTVGEYLPDSGVREILAESRGIKLEGQGDARRHDWMKKVGWEKIGADRIYESMVFYATEADFDDICCPWVQRDGRNIDGDGYNTAASAREGHMQLCAKYAAKED